MKHAAAYLLAVLGGNATPSAEDVSKIIVASGGSVDDEKLAALIAEFEGKDVAEVVAAGMAKVKNCNVSGGSSAPAAAAAAPAAAAEAPKKEVKKEEVVDALEGGMNMFGGGGGGDY